SALHIAFALIAALPVYSLVRPPEGYRPPQEDILRTNLFLELETLQVFAEGAAQVLALQGEFHRSFQKTQLIASIVTLAFVDVGVHLFLLQQNAHAVCQLKFASGAGRSLGEAV